MNCAFYSAYILSILGIFVGWTNAVPAQTGPVKSPFGIYSIEGENVVFEFNRQTYVQALRSADSATVDLADLEMIVPLEKGNEAFWTKEGWRLKRINPNRYQAYKPCYEFTDAPDWWFKLLLEGVYWIVPDPKPAKKGVLGNYETPETKWPEAMPNDTGNVLFTLKGFNKASRVILAGTFNGWNEQALSMKPTSTGWEMRLQLASGRYEYKFIVDGQWLHDPANSNKKVNEHHTYNSVLWVARPTRFTLKGYQNAQKVVVSGAFNNWSRTEAVMRPTPDGWAYDTVLTGNKHLYKFIIDGGWVLDPANPRTEKTWDGHTNSVLIIK